MPIDPFRHSNIPGMLTSGVAALACMPPGAETILAPPAAPSTAPEGETKEERRARRAAEREAFEIELERKNAIEKAEKIAARATKMARRGARAFRENHR